MTSDRDGVKQTDDMREYLLMTSHRDGEKKTDDTRVNS